jgi:hypothetical protein
MRGLPGAADEERISRPGLPGAEVVRLDDVRAAARDLGTDEERHAIDESREGRDSSVELHRAEAYIETSSDRALVAVRAHPALVSLHRGGHLHHAERGDTFGWIARSFAGIYVLVVVFESAFDELRVERAIQHSLPIIERLVLALPPHDPAPMAGAMAIRRRPR